MTLEGSEEGMVSGAAAVKTVEYNVAHPALAIVPMAYEMFWCL